MAQPELCGSEFEHSEEVCGVLLVARGEASEVFDPIEEPFDAIARSVEHRAKAGFPATMDHRRDVGRGPCRFDGAAQPITETRADSLDLIVDPGALDALRSRVGVSVARPLTLGDSQVLSELRAAWTHDFLDNRGAFAAAFSGAPAVTFSQVGAAAGRDAAELGAGVRFAIAQTAIPGQLSAFIQYDATIAAHQIDNAVAAGLKLT